MAKHTEPRMDTLKTDVLLRDIRERVDEVRGRGREARQKVQALIEDLGGEMRDEDNPAEALRHLEIQGVRP